MTEFIEEENKLLNVCVLDETSRFYNVPNSKELIEEIKQQMETHIEIQKNYVINGNTVLGSYNLSDIFSTYDNPKIVDNQLYIDLKLLNTLCKVFVEPDGASYTSRDSRVYIEFPYTHKTEYVNVENIKND